MSIKIIVPVGLIAIGAGLFGISQQYLNQSNVEEVTAAPVEQEKRVKVLVLNEHLDRGQVLSPVQFSIKQIPESQIPVSQGDIAEIIPNGAVARKALSSGEWLQTSMYVTPDQQGYIDATISDQMVPYPIIVNRESIVGGVIDHGTKVDVIALSSQQQNLAIEDEVNEFQSVSVSPILLAVKVLKIEKPRDPRYDYKQSDERRDNRRELHKNRNQGDPRYVKRNTRVNQKPVKAKPINIKARNYRGSAANLVPDKKKVHIKF